MKKAFLSLLIFSAIIIANNTQVKAQATPEELMEGFKEEQKELEE